MSGTEKTSIFLISAPDEEGEVVSEIISSSAEKVKAEPERPQLPEGYEEFRECADSVVTAYAKYKGLNKHQLAVHCGVSYTMVKYWCRHRSCPSHSLYNEVFKDFFLNIYKSGME